MLATWLQGVVALLGPWSAVLGVLTAFSAATLVACAVALPRVVAGLPEDYLVRDDPPARRHGLAVRLLRNTAGGVLVLAGVAMLVLPGQGLLTLFVGLLLVDVPGKDRAVRLVLRQPGVATAIGWLRERAGVPPLRLPESPARRLDA